MVRGVNSLLALAMQSGIESLVMYQTDLTLTEQLRVLYASSNV